MVMMMMTVTMMMMMLMIMMIEALMSHWGARSADHPQAFDQGNNNFGGTPGSFLAGTTRRR
eukprot:2132-Karenia_brevis.AAC.1